MFNLKAYDIPIDLLLHVILKHISYFDLDNVLPYFKLSPKEIANIKYKIYKSRLTITQFSSRIEYSIEGKRHRETDPAIEWADGDKEWWANGKRHRDKLPAMEYGNRHKVWWVNGKLHRLDGPAVKWPNGDLIWYLEGKLHRIDGPAIIKADGDKEWWENDKRIR